MNRKSIDTLSTSMARVIPASNLNRSRLIEANQCKGIRGVIARQVALDCLLQSARDRTLNIDTRVLRTYCDSNSAPHQMARSGRGGDYPSSYAPSATEQFPVAMLSVKSRLQTNLSDICHDSLIPIMCWSHYAPRYACCLLCGEWKELRISVCKQCACGPLLINSTFAEFRSAWSIPAIRLAPIIEYYPDGRLLVYSGARLLFAAAIGGYTHVESIVYQMDGVKGLPKLQDAPDGGDQFGFFR